MCLLAAPVAGGSPSAVRQRPAPMRLRSHPSTSSSLPQTSLSGPEPLPGSSQSVIWQQTVGRCIEADHGALKRVIHLT